ncbi:ARF GTPase-activating protein GIT2-like [Paramacrobiotus metropolitanus]|uniref:ARF GTPase-activating protein GIT2-like n=1 Tax=Paramacrobiotus metropolitanus TaxID=2943436 RepID=UPI00244624B6|nr:ARF GTPase-activating protein GIT2-like [Paramacrobiotus metropolitanus]
MNTPQQQSPWRSPAVGGIATTTTIINQICADCGAADATWASVNRGVLICEECCSIHRVLGRHVTQVKPLPLARARPQRRSTASSASGSPSSSAAAGCWHWPPTLLTMVTSLYSKGANGLWEYCLLHPGSSSGHTSLTSSGSSPSALAAAAATGHKQHSQTQRRKPSPKDPIHPNKSDFIRAKYQLQSFIHRPTRDDSQSTLEDGNRPLHVAAKAGQASQAELLIVCGADPGAPDRLAFFLCNRRPDHAAGQHFPYQKWGITCQGEDAHTPTHRRPSGFLPVNPKLSSTHNQMRQKLGTLNSRDLAGLIIDLLTEIRRRQGGGDSARALPAPVPTPQQATILSVSRAASRGPSTEREVDRDVATRESPVYDVTLDDREDEDYLDFAPAAGATRGNAQVVRAGKEPIYAQVRNVRLTRETSQQSVTAEQTVDA